MKLRECDGVLLLDTAPLRSGDLLRKTAFKMRCRVFVEGTFDDGAIALKPCGNHGAYAEMVAGLGRVLERMGYVLEVDPALEARFASMREYAEERYRLGNELKRRDPKHGERFAQFSGTVDAAMVRPLKERQMWDAFFMATMRRAGNFSVPGSGKTATVLGAFAFLAARGKVRRLMVVCPKNAFDSWRTEWRLCFGEKRPLVCFSTQDEDFRALSAVERRAYVRSSVGAANLLLVNYEAAQGIAEELAGVAARETLLVFDEVHRVKSVGGIRAAACLTIAQGAPAAFALTGTPIPNTYEDLYNFLHILFPREYDSFFGYEPGELRNAGDAERAEINERLQPFYCRTTKDDLGVPPACADEVVAVASEAGANELLDMLIARYRASMLVLMVRVLQLEADPAMLVDSLDASEYRWLLDEDDETGEVDTVDYSSEVEDAIRRAAAQPTEKRRACAALVEGMVAEGRPVIIWCIFKRSMHAIRGDLAARGIEARVIDGGVPLDVRERILDGFRGGAFPVLITNPHTLAESVSLHMVCHDAVYFEYSFNLVHLLQSKDRIHRLGLPLGQQTRYHFLMQHFDHKGRDYSMDERIYTRLREKEDTMMRAIEADLIETQPTTEEDLEAIFEGLFS